MNLKTQINKKRNVSFLTQCTRSLQKIVSHVSHHTRRVKVQRAETLSRLQKYRDCSLYHESGMMVTVYAYNCSFTSYISWYQLKAAEENGSLFFLSLIGCRVRTPWRKVTAAKYQYLSASRALSSLISRPLSISRFFQYHVFSWETAIISICEHTSWSWVNDVNRFRKKGVRRRG